MRRLFPRAMRAGSLAVAISLVLAATLTGPASAQSPGIPRGDDPILRPGTQRPVFDEHTEEFLQQQDIAFMSRRTAGDNQLDNQQAGAMRAAAAQAAKKLLKAGVPTSGPTTFDAAWGNLGPNPIVQGVRSPGRQAFSAMSGRIGALAIRKNGQFILGAAQGGIWLYTPNPDPLATVGTWTPMTDDLPSLSIGALKVAPSNDLIVYAGTGEGALSGDSYYGNGILKSSDGGAHWAHVSGDFFQAVSISSLVVDPANANHLFVSVLRGRGGARRTTPPDHSRFGIWESNDGAVSWTLLKEAKAEANGATDIELDPQSAQILYASFWGDAIYKSTNGGATWAPIMTGLPIADYATHQTRFSIAISHPAGAAATLYAGFDWEDAAGDHPSRVFKSTDAGAHWTITSAGSPPNKVEDYCGGQCFYDNVIEANPTNPNIVFAAGQFDYGIGSGGIFRSDDGGATWRNLGWDQHPDYHALAFDPSDPARVLVGSDGGVWYSTNGGGRQDAASPLSAVTWQDLNGTVNRLTAAVTGRSNLAIGQFTSIATVPQIPVRFWGGTQDNGTLRKSGGTASWFDIPSGDGGQVLVDPTFDPVSDACPPGFAPACFVYGTYFGVSPYRMDDGGAFFFNNQSISRGINTADRSDFYIPFVMNKANTNQLFLGTYRLYRTNNARATSAGDVVWRPISPDLTTGCTGIAPNGARNCTISAIGVGGGQAVYTGSLDGLVYLSTDAQVNDNPTWTRLGKNKLPNRPVTQIAVDPSNYRIAYLSYAGFGAATKTNPGHVYRTTDGGAAWLDISGNLPDSPVNSIILDPSYANTLYAGTDIGPFVTYNGGVNWEPLGSGFPVVTIWQLDLDPSHRLMAAGTHGRGAFRITDPSAAVPALVLSKVDAGNPVGPSSNVTYTLTLRNIGNANATGVTITDPAPANTTFVSADMGGTNVGGTVTWPNLSVLAGSSITVHFTVSIADALKKKATSIVNDGMKATSAQGPFTTGSPFITPIAPPYAVSVAPATQTDGGQLGTSVSYTVTVKNLGFNADSYTMSAVSPWTATFFQPNCTTSLTTTPTLTAGASTIVCVKVAIPAAAANGAINTATVTATSVASPTVSASATIKTIAVAANATLLVDNDGNGPDVQPIYTAALTSAGVTFSVWDLSTDSNIPLNYMKAFKTIVWFTGNSYPGPILPYETKLASFLDGGGRLFISGQDLLDQAAGTTAFVQNYLHVDWDGSETQNDKFTASVHGVAGLVTGVAPAIGTVPLDHTVLGAAFEDQITPNGGAVAEFADASSETNALSFRSTTAPYRVVFLAFPLEAYGTATQKSDLVTRVMNFFAAP